MNMLLSKLAHEAGEELLELRGDCEIEALSMDSRRKMTNGLFFCIPGARFDAHDFAAQALENGAVGTIEASKITVGTNDDLTLQIYCPWTRRSCW